MEFFKGKKLRRARQTKAEDDLNPESNQVASEEPKVETVDLALKAAAADPTVEEEEDDDDFITNEVKRRLKELRKNSFMVLIPEESCPEEESSSSEWRESEVEDGHPWYGFDTLYNKYCERMLFFDKMITQQLQEAGSWNISNHSPRSVSKKLALTLRNLSFKRRDELRDDCEHLQQSPEEDPYHNLETAYVAQICLTWEALHCQYTQVSQKISFQPDNATTYCYVAQGFQQFQVLLERFIENEPFELGSRVEIYARTRSSLSKLLQVPSFQGLDQKENEADELDPPIYSSDLLNIMEESILTFLLFIKMDKRKSVSTLNLFKGHNQDESSLQQVKASLEKKETKVKELSKSKGWKKKSWSATPYEVELLFGLIDIKVVSRVLRMTRISKEQLLWCEEKMGKLDLSENKLHRDGSPILFPC